jgi:hypothetical protein
MNWSCICASLERQYVLSAKPNGTKRENNLIPAAVSLFVCGAIQKFPKYINKNYYVLPGFYSAPSPSWEHNNGNTFTNNKPNHSTRHRLPH